MKKVFKWCLMIALFLLVGAVIYVMIAYKSSFDEALELVFVGAGSVGTALLVLIPIFTKIKQAENLIEIATSNCSNQNENNQAIVSDIEKLKSEQEETIKKQNEIILSLSTELNNIKTILKLGFINNKELVSKGVADEIAKVGGNDENKE